MSVPYDAFTGAFLAKIMEYDFVDMDTAARTDLIDGYMKRAVSQFRKICKYNLDDVDDNNRVFNADIPQDDLEEILDIVSEGMVVQWLKPYLFHQDNLYGVLNTKDFTTYSRSELIYRIGGAHSQAKKDFTNMCREYSYHHGDLSDLHT